MEIQEFNNSELNIKIRTKIDDDGELWFAAKDICYALGIQNTSKALADLRKKVGDADSLIMLDVIQTAGGAQKLSFVNEKGMYHLIFSSRKNHSIVNELIKNMRLEISTVLDILNEFDAKDLPEDRFVYVARESISGRYKIGISKNPERRIKELNIGNPEELELVAVYKANKPGYQSEINAHKCNGLIRIRSEWFDAESDITKIPEAV
jgi:hypothetical protein